MTGFYWLIKSELRPRTDLLATGFEKMNGKTGAWEHVRVQSTAENKRHMHCGGLG